MKNTKQFTDQEISAAKEKSIVGFLKSQNIEPVNMIGGEFIYLSPLRTENTASFHVNIKKNRFNDFGGTEEMRGDAIRLVQQLKKCSFPQAIATLLETDYPDTVSFSFSGPMVSTSEKGQIVVRLVQNLQNQALIRYITNRGILLQHAFDYLKEVHYVCDDRNFFAVGFKNDSGGYELRNGLGFKGKTENGITTLDRDTESVSIFEGVFDFLSALRYYNCQKPSNTAIILNTTNNLKLALPLLSNRKSINCYLDNDAAGENTVKKLISCGFNVKDWSKIIYPNSKDFNDFLVSNSNSKA